MPALPGRIPNFSNLDGKGGNEPTLAQDGKTGKCMERMDLNCVYYRLYTTLGAIESYHPIYSNDRFIGRMPSKSFAPPHTVASIKRYLCKFEGILEPGKSFIFVPLSSPTPKEDSARLSLYAPSGPGMSEQEPIVLLVESEKRSRTITRSEELPERSDDEADIRYIHYRVYSSEGDEKSKTSFNENDGSLGRINTYFVAPPHTVGSLKASIAKVEGLVTPSHALYKDMELFENMNSDAAMSDADVLSFLSDTYPGSNKGDPIALVNATADISVYRKSTSGSSSTNISETPSATTRTSSDLAFTKRARLTRVDNDTRYGRSMLPITNGEIVGTDGKSIPIWLCPFTGEIDAGYVVLNSKGKKCFVHEDCVEVI